MPNEPYVDEVTREGSVTTGGSGYPTDTFVEEPVHVSDYFRTIAPTGKGIYNYVYSLFPFLHWIGRYNLIWLAGDLVAGITIGAVVVPQGMGYAKLAELPVEFGLYSSFMGVVIYWFFATSKDITIGPVAVMSTLTGDVVLALQDQFPDLQGYQIASALAILAGAIVFFIGFIRIGWIVDMIPLVSLSAYMTGSALNILVGQVPTLLGETFPSPWTTRDPTYRVIINSLKYLPSAKADAGMGLGALFMLYGIRSACTLFAKKFPNRQKMIFFISTLRTVFVILLFTLISWLVNMNHRSDPTFKILGTVPSGFQHAGAPVITKDLCTALVSFLPSTVIVLLIEHIAISKSFGRVNNYTINPSQEMVAIGVANLLGPLLGAYPATGSFSRTAIKARAGVRTPFAGVISGAVVVIAIYGLTAVFFYIPSASLSAVIIHAVGDLVTPPDTVYQFWRVSPLEVIIFFIGVLVTVFSSIEDGIYSTIAISAALLLYRLLRNRGTFLGRLKVRSVHGTNLLGQDSSQHSAEYGTFNGSGSRSHVDFPKSRNIFLPLDHHDGSNPALALEQPYPGVFIYRFSEGFNYPNANYTLEFMVEEIFRQTRRTNLTSYPRPGDRPWNDPGPTKRQLKKAAAGDINLDASKEDLPTVKAIILDFSAVNYVDLTSVQALIDIRNQLDRYAAPDVVDWHIACINNRWAKRALVAAGFGYPLERPDGLHHRWQSIFSVAEIGGDNSAAAAAEHELNEKELRERQRRSQDHNVEDGLRNRDDINVAETGSASGSSQDDDIKKSGGVQTLRQRRAVTVTGVNRPLFHVDLTSALQGAIANIEARQSSPVGGEDDAGDIKKL
ncbi:hypothetical protein N0V93_001164 [Gnomoniopsis smithogilvyi]|uniref:STAS domain-containing protein n=1 Tax=Gnomoniopsis smithogilvyi TaxID=1191159 RepID=A0A9W8Z5E3_9PEZI|nr:hypothetical protein N0V93_001164 [Gnomoniopsis smithogilvyi]